VDNINESTLFCEGAPLKNCTKSNLNGDPFPDFACKIDTCPKFGPNLAKLEKNPDGTVAVTCTGQLDSTTAILGTDPSVKIN